MKKLDLLNLIDKEIDLINNKNRSSGWTRWALITASASILLLLASQEINSYTTYNLKIAGIYLIIILFVENCISFFRGIVYREKPVDKYSRFLFLSSVAEYLITNIGLNIFTIFIIFKTSVIPSKILELVFYTYYIATTFIIFIILSFAFFDVPFNSNNIPKGSHIFSKILNFILFLLFLITLINILINNTFIFQNISALKISFLFFGLLFILKQLTLIDVEYPTIQNLINLRRSLIFNHISVTDASNQIEIILLGMKIEDVLKRKVNIILDLHNAINEKITKIKYQLKKRDFENIEMEIKEIDKLLNTAISEYSKFKIKAKWIIALNKKNAETVDIISKKIYIAASMNRKNFKDFTIKFEKKYIPH